MKRSYSDRELLDLLHSFYLKIGKNPSAASLAADPDTPNPSTYRTRFGSWTKAKELAGISTTNKFGIKTEKELLESLKRFYALEGRAPAQRECKSENNLYGPNTYKDSFGSWDSALYKAGIPKASIRCNQVEEDVLIESISRFYKETGRAPRHEDCNNLEEYTYLKSHMVYKRRFGTFTQALLVANVPLNDTNVSGVELELRDYIASLYNGKIVTNSKDILPSGLELDIYLPELSIAFEFNGLYWHSDAHKAKLYHLSKTEECEALGIRLIHVFEHEWRFKKPIVHSRIQNLLQLLPTIYARNCKILEVSSKDSSVFLESNHLQGNAFASVRLGLYLDGELVALQTFCKSRFNKDHTWELLRYCNKVNTSVVGGASKLFKHFKKLYPKDSVVSYSDRRWNTGELYKALGFNLLHTSAPNYWYFKGLKLESRQKYQKHKLSGILKHFDESLSERENMENNGYYRIYDCGNYVFSYSV